MPEPTHELRSMAGTYGAHKSWANTEDRTARTEPGRRAAYERYEHEVDPDGLLAPDERARRARHAQQAHMAKMALASVKARRARDRKPKTAPPKATATERKADADG